MKTTRKYQEFLKKFGQTIAFTAAIMFTTVLTLKFDSVTSASTVAFCFIIIVLLSAFFGNTLVAMITSIVATLCFDYFYLPPFGTFNIAAFSDWVSLTAFLLTAVIISRLTASAAENTAKADDLDTAIIRLKEFGIRLMSTPNNQLTLSKIAEEALSVFSLEYCSIHVYGEGKWQHFTGAAASPDISHAIENQLTIHQDHTSNLMEIAEESMLGVQYIKFYEKSATHAVFVVKTTTLSANTIGAIASIIGIRIIGIMKDNNS